MTLRFPYLRHCSQTDHGKWRCICRPYIHALFVSALRQAFVDIDVDKSGRINRKELRAALQLIGQNPSKSDMQRYMPDGEFRSED